VSSTRPARLACAQRLWSLKYECVFLKICHKMRSGTAQRESAWRRFSGPRISRYSACPSRPPLVTAAVCKQLLPHDPVHRFGELDVETGQPIRFMGGEDDP
jgi:hypothetical protein